MISALALALAACGGSASSVALSGTGDAAAVAQAEAAVKSLTERPRTLEVTPLPSKPPTGGTLAYMACGAPVCQAFGKLLKQATDSVGWEMKTIQIGLTPETVSAGYDEAVRSRPDGVIGSGGFPASLMSHQLDELKGLDIPAVLMNVPDKGGATGSFLGSDFQGENGTHVGDWIMADSKGRNAHVAIVTTEATPVYANAHDALKKALASCTGCSVDQFSYAYTDLGTSLPTKVATYLASHRDVNYLFFDFSTAAIGVPAALQSAGLADKVKLTMTTVGQTELGYLKKGQVSVTALVPWQEGLWAAFDVVLRSKMRLPVEPALSVKLPNMIMTKDNVIDVTSDAPPPLVADYQSQFKKAWQVG